MGEGEGRVEMGGGSGDLDIETNGACSLRVLRNTESPGADVLGVRVGKPPAGPGQGLAGGHGAGRRGSSLGRVGYYLLAFFSLGDFA